MPKKATSWNGFHILRALIVVFIVIYILGIVPQFTNIIKGFVSNPLMKIVFLSLIVLAGYLDSTIGILLAVAFLLSYLSTPEYKASPVHNVLSGIQHGANQVVGDVGSGAHRLVGGVGATASELVGGVGLGAQNVIGGLQRGTQQITGGLTSGTEHVLRGAEDIASGIEGGVQQVVGGLSGGARELVGGTQSLVSGVGKGAYQVVGGLGSGAQALVGSVESGAQQLISGAQEGTQYAISGLQRGTQHLIGGSENMTNGPSQSVSQVYQQHMKTQDEQSGCGVQPTMTTGCDPIVGYNSPYNCGCSGACGGKCEGLDPECLCKGVQVWKDELNAQGLNHPRGYAGGQVGSTY